MSPVSIAVVPARVPLRTLSHGAKKLCCGVRRDLAFRPERKPDAHLSDTYRNLNCATGRKFGSTFIELLRMADRHATSRTGGLDRRTPH